MAEHPKYPDLTAFGQCVINLYVYNTERKTLRDNTAFLPTVTQAQINEWLTKKMDEPEMIAHNANKRDFYLTMGDARSIVLTLDQRDPKTNARNYPGHEALDSCEKYHRPIGELYNAVIRPDRVAKFR